MMVQKGPKLRVRVFHKILRNSVYIPTSVFTVKHEKMQVPTVYYKLQQMCISKLYILYTLDYQIKQNLQGQVLAHWVDLICLPPHHLRGCPRTLLRHPTQVLLYVCISPSIHIFLIPLRIECMFS